MLKSFNSRLSVFSLAALFLISCNHNKSTSKDTKPKIDSSAQIAEKEPIVSKTDTSEVKFEIETESGLKASELGAAIFKGELEKFKDLIQKGSQLDKCLTDDTFIFDALYAAILYDKMEMIDYILKNKLYTDINVTYTEDAETPLTMACDIENKDNALQVSSLLILNGANVNGAGESGGDYTKAPLHIAVAQNNPKLVALILEKGGIKDIIDKASGDSPLALAEKKGYTEIVELLK